MEELINIHTGEVADRNINAYEGYEIGLKIIESMTGVDINKFTFKEKDRTVIMKLLDMGVQQFLHCQF